MTALRSLLALFVLAGCGLALAACGAESDPRGLVFEPVTADDLMQEVRAAESDLVVVNFWASWCLPCREEFPAFLRFQSETDPSDVRVAFVTVDFEEDLPHAAQFMREQGLDAPTYVKDGKEGAFITAIAPSWTGAIPATAIFDREGNRLAFWEGTVTYDQLVRRIDAARASS